MTTQSNELPISLAMLIQRADDAETIQTFSREIGPHLTLEEVTSKEILADAIDWSQYDLFILDEEIKAFDTIGFVKQLRGLNSSMSIIMLTRKSDRKRAVEAMKAGATDYIFKRDLNREIFEKSIKYCQERTIHDREIRQRNVLIESLFEQSNDAIFLCDNEWNIMEFNQELESFFKLSKTSKYNLMSLTEGNQFKELHQLIAADKELVNREFLVLHAGAKKYYSISTKHIQLPELGFRTLGTIYDITARKMAENEQIRNEKLELTARMARILAHEVRNPLTNIRLSIDYISEFFENDDEGKMYAEIIERNTERINKLIDDLLQSSRPFELDFSMVKISDVVQDVLTQTNDRKELLGVEISTHISPDIPMWLCDDEKLALALINLTTNAFEAMQHRERPFLSLNVEMRNDHLLIMLQDNGKGMSEEVSEKLFDAFFSARKGGMGLGMTTVKNIVKGHQGSITVRSQEEIGTTFEILLPRLEQ